VSPRGIICIRNGWGAEKIGSKLEVEVEVCLNECKAIGVIISSAERYCGSPCVLCCVVVHLCVSSIGAFVSIHSL
jgi:hypothetical protein